MLLKALLVFRWISQTVVVMASVSRPFFCDEPSQLHREMKRHYISSTDNTLSDNNFITNFNVDIFTINFCTVKMVVLVWPISTVHPSLRHYLLLNTFI